ncbi:L,D-transpeptidase family protein [Sphingomonas oligophenolica]|uniref:Murein L,D-transpeptidase n=1 Tax=Sphingomonas oligophenolica TaxID=301154 RepID=A0A502CPR4_9SPHN|nr:L,D-transpeptidase family protein [Sphingomonas oligophenolica]TPG13701.1 murein L,D-transpeptidase [Sphingomonas oligophenolica]
MTITPRTIVAGAALAAALASLTASPALGAQSTPNAAVAPSPIDAAALKSAASESATQAFYQRNGWRPVWTTDAAQAFDAALADRAQHGLDKVEFLQNPDSQNKAVQEVARTGAALRYASALAKGVVDPSTLHDVYTIPRPGPDLIGGLTKAVAEGNLGAWFASLVPQDGDYAALSSAYRRYAEQSGGGTAAIADNGLIHIGDRDPRVPAIVQQLRGGGYYSTAGGSTGQGASAPATGGAASGNQYTARIATAMKQLQRDYGIRADGVVGPDTLTVLNLRPGDRARALAVAMERLRWLRRAPPATRIDVNTAAASLNYYRDGTLVDTRKVIVGQPGRETPSLLAPIYRLVANPTWTVPKSIEKAEMAHVGASYLKSHNMVRRGGYIVQLSGPTNALGLVKFDMKDDQAIYLHDTEAPSLFDRSQRQLSHGCVRVYDALGFAQMIAADEGVTEAWDKAHAGSDQSFVALPHEIPVRLLYHNVFVDAGGDIAFRTDPYGWNAPIAKALGFRDTSNARAHADAIDLGP